MVLREVCENCLSFHSLIGQVFLYNLLLHPSCAFMQSLHLEIHHVILPVSNIILISVCSLLVAKIIL